MTLFQKVLLFIVPAMLFCFEGISQEPKTFNMELSNSNLSAVLNALAEKGGWKLALKGSIDKAKVNMKLSDKTVEEALDLVVKEHNLDYYFSGDELVVRQLKGTGRAPASAQGPEIRHIRLNFVNSLEILANVKEIMGADEGKVYVDSATNSLIMDCNDRTFERVKNYLDLIDHMPQQVLIEAKIAEVSKNFSRDFGINLSTANSSASGDKTSTLTGGVATAVPGTPNFNLGYQIKTVDQTTLNLALAAAEDNGEAEIISRPKVVTLNNKEATINSGISFSVKTLSNVSSGPGSDGSTAAGGIEKVRAGLTLTVLPIIMGDDNIRLNINVTNSEPDAGSAVDGIPGIIDNSAQTSIIVRNGKVAIIAGLIKRSSSEGTSGVPFLSKIPILGWFFKSYNTKERNKELFIFIAPKIIFDNGLLNGRTEKISAFKEEDDESDDDPKTDEDRQP